MRAATTLAVLHCAIQLWQPTFAARPYNPQEADPASGQPAISTMDPAAPSKLAIDSAAPSTVQAAEPTEAPSAVATPPAYESTASSLEYTDQFQESPGTTLDESSQSTTDQPLGAGSSSYNHAEQFSQSTDQPLEPTRNSDPTDSPRSSEPSLAAASTTLETSATETTDSPLESTVGASPSSSSSSPDAVAADSSESTFGASPSSSSSSSGIVSVDSSESPVADPAVSSALPANLMAESILNASSSESISSPAASTTQPIDRSILASALGSTIDASPVPEISPASPTDSSLPSTDPELRESPPKPASSSALPTGQATISGYSIDSDSSDPSGAPLLIISPTNTLPSSITPQPRPHHPHYSGCQPRQCTANASFISIFYWPPKSSRTDCLTSITELPDSSVPSDLTMVYPSVYAIVYSFTADDGCSQIGNAFDTFTASFAPDQISSLAPNVMSWDPQRYDFGDLPCGPPGVDQPYQPWFAPPHALFDQMGGTGYGGCGIYPFADPFISLQKVDSVNGPDLPDNPDHTHSKKPRGLVSSGSGSGMEHKTTSSSHGSPPAPETAVEGAVTAHVVPNGPARTPHP